VSATQPAEYAQQRSPLRIDDRPSITSKMWRE
jgi:hypothetical protein